MEETHPNDIITDEQIIASASESSQVKTGYKTTEFWLTVLANLVPVIQGFLVEGSVEAQIASSVVAVLATLGYTVSRTLVKR